MADTFIEACIEDGLKDQWKVSLFLDNNIFQLLFSSYADNFVRTTIFMKSGIVEILSLEILDKDFFTQ